MRILYVCSSSIIDCIVPIGNGGSLPAEIITFCFPLGEERVE